MNFLRHPRLASSLGLVLAVASASFAIAAAAAPTATPGATPNAKPNTATALPTPDALNVPVPPPPDIDANSWVLMDFTSGQILASHNPDERVAPASITKIMTAYIVSAELAAGKVKMDDPVYISENAWKTGGAGTDGSTSFLAVHSKVPLKDLLYGMIIQSGNDAAIALAEHIAGSESNFAALMNAYAKRLGMTGTHYVDATGLAADGHYTTAQDIAKLARAVIHDYPQEYKIYSVKQFEWNGITQHNRNTLLWRDPSVDGIKTGHTSQAGYCLVASAKRGHERLISVVMHTPSEQQRANDSEALLNYGFHFFETHKLYAADKPLVQPRLWKGAAATLPLGVAQDVLVTLPRGRYKELNAQLQIPGRLIAPYNKGQQVGKLIVSLDGKTLTEQPLVALADAPAAGFWGRTYDSVMLWFKGDAKTVVTSKPGTP